MRRQINNIISVLCTLLRFSVMKLFHWKDFRFSLIERFSPDVVTEFNRGSKVHIGKGVRVHSGTKIKVRSGAELKIGANTKINYDCIIACHESVSIGAGTELGPAVFLYDHDHDYSAGLNADSGQERFQTSPIEIGRNCWIGANTVILRGTKIGDYCVVGAGGVIKGVYPDHSMIIQKRETLTRKI